MAFTRPTLPTLIARAIGDIKAALPTSDPFLRRSILGVLARMCAGLAHGLYGYLSYQADQLIYDTAETDFLERWGSVWGIQRKEATQSNNSVDFTGNDGSTVSGGSTWQTGDGVQFTVDADQMIAGGVATANLTAVLGGSAGNVPVGATLTAVNPLPGVNSQATVAAANTVGVDVETDDELRARLLFLVQNQPNGGASNDYVQWALSIAGVTRAWTYPDALGRGTVVVRFVMDDAETGPIPDVGTIAAVQAYIDQPAVRPVGADVAVVAPIADALAMTIQISPNTPAIQAAITAEMQDLMLRESQPASEDGEVILLLSQIREAVTSASDDELDSIIIAPAANVTALTGHMPVLTLPITFAAIP